MVFLIFVLEKQIPQTTLYKFKKKGKSHTFIKSGITIIAYIIEKRASPVKGPKWKTLLEKRNQTCINNNAKFYQPKEQARAMPTMPPPTTATSYWSSLFVKLCLTSDSWNVKPINKVKHYASIQCNLEWNYFIVRKNCAWTQEKASWGKKKKLIIILIIILPLNSYKLNHGQAGKPPNLWIYKSSLFFLRLSIPSRHISYSTIL